MLKYRKGICEKGISIPNRPKKEIVDIYAGYPDVWEYVTDIDFGCTLWENKDKYEKENK